MHFYRFKIKVGGQHFEMSNGRWILQNIGSNGHDTERWMSLWTLEYKVNRVRKLNETSSS